MHLGDGWSCLVAGEEVSAGLWTWDAHARLIPFFFFTCHCWNLQSINFFFFFSIVGFVQARGQWDVGVRMGLRVVRLYSPTVCLCLFFCGRGRMREAGQHRIQYHQSSRNKDGMNYQHHSFQSYKTFNFQSYKTF